MSLNPGHALLAYFCVCVCMCACVLTKNQHLCFLSKNYHRICCFSPDSSCTEAMLQQPTVSWEWQLEPNEGKECCKFTSCLPCSIAKRTRLAAMHNFHWWSSCQWLAVEGTPLHSPDTLQWHWLAPTVEREYLRQQTPPPIAAKKYEQETVHFPKIRPPDL